MNVDSRFEIAPRIPRLVDPFVARTDAGDSVTVNEKLRAGESRKNVHAVLFDLFAEPAGELV